jgi:hypothetical protein
LKHKDGKEYVPLDKTSPSYYKGTSSKLFDKLKILIAIQESTEVKFNLEWSFQNMKLSTKPEDILTGARLAATG